MELFLEAFDGRSVLPTFQQNLTLNTSSSVHLEVNWPDVFAIALFSRGGTPNPALNGPLPFVVVDDLRIAFPTDPDPNPTSVPEPIGFSIFGAGIITALAIRRRIAS